MDRGPHISHPASALHPPVSGHVPGRTRRRVTCMHIGHQVHPNCWTESKLSGLVRYSTGTSELASSGRIRPMLEERSRLTIDPYNTAKPHRLHAMPAAALWDERHTVSRLLFTFSKRILTIRTALGSTPLTRRKASCVLSCRPSSPTVQRSTRLQSSPTSTTTEVIGSTRRSIGF